LKLSVYKRRGKREMPEHEIENQELESPAPQRRRRLSRRNLTIVGVVAVIGIAILLFVSVVSYRYGVFDPWIKSQFTAKMADIGIAFTADEFALKLAPMELHLVNATFNDRVTGEKLFFIRDARLGLTVDNLYAWQLSRDISINTTDIDGAEVWVNFDENGRSNYANLKLVEEAPGRVNFKYESIIFKLTNGTVHVGDVTRKISGDARNVLFSLAAEHGEETDRLYRIDLTSTQSRFIYDQHPLEPIDIHAKGVATNLGADITELRIDTPLGTSFLNGKIDDWKALKYDLNIESNVDLTQASNTFPLGATLRGVGNFKGKVTGEGENYRIEGVADSQALQADGVYLKAVNVDATVAGTNGNYEANGRAVAELLTFEDFRVEFPRLAGNVRGIGTDFRWIGELQAAAVKSGSMTIGGLFLRDAVAELKDKTLQLDAAIGNIQKFSVADIEIAQLRTSNVRLIGRDGSVTITSPTAAAASLRSRDYELNSLTGRNLSVKRAGSTTNVDIKNLTAQNARLKNNRVNGLRADSFALTDKPTTTDLKFGNVTAASVDADGTRINGVSAPEITIADNAVETRIYSDNVRVASLITGGATLGSLNIGGVRLTIREGRIEGTSNDIDAGNIELAKSETLANGGSLNAVKIVKPVFVLEPSGRYRASADMSIGGGIVGSVPLGNATAKVNINNDRAVLDALNASVMSGQVNGQAQLAFNKNSASQINLDFSNLDLSKLLSLQSGRVMPLEGQTTGRADLTFQGTDFRTATGTVRANIAANAGTDDATKVPVTGRVELAATNGLFNIQEARLNSARSTLDATGRFDLRGNDSNLQFALNSSDASEIDRIIRVLGVAPDVSRQLDSMEAQFAGDLKFNATLTGNISDPIVAGNASVYSVILHGRDVGTVETAINVSPTGVELSNGVLRERTGGGTATFSAAIPYGGANNTEVTATLNGINAGNMLAALPITLPERIRDFEGKTSGTVNLQGLPNAASGNIDISAANGTIAGQAFDSLKARADFSGTRITITSGEIRVGDGYLALNGNYDRSTTAFDFDLNGKNIPLPLALAFLPKSDSLPTFAGMVDLTAKATGQYDRAATYRVNFDGSARDVVINNNSFGVVTFKGSTVDQVLRADVTALLDGKAQPVTATLDFRDDNLPLTIVTDLKDSALGPLFALVPQLRDYSITGTGTGRVELAGNISAVDAQGNRYFTSDSLAGTARFTALNLRIQDTPLAATEPVSIKIGTRDLTFESARFAGGGSNVTIAGTVAFAAGGRNDLAIDGRLNLSLLNVFRPVRTSDTFFGGFADASVHLAGTFEDSELTGTATAENASIATFIGSDRFTFDRMNGRVLFNSKQAQIERMTGYLGGGQFSANGGILFTDDLQIGSYRVAINGTNITVPYPKDFTTTGDAQLEISGSRVGSDLTTAVTGNIRATRSLYTKDIDLATIVGARREATLASGTASLYEPRFDLSIEGRNALVVQNNLADLTASASLRITGSADNPQITGRIVANGGQLFFRRDRYDIQRGVLEFPPNTLIDPVINLQAESQIGGYQVFVNLNGPLTDTELLNATVRSSPALPQADVISLITTGSLTNTGTGIPTLAQTGINTAAEVLTDSIINNPVRKATDRLFGLNVFEIDPIISGERLNPTARLTVGRQINNNLRVTYSTNLSQDQNQVLAFEYRVSNKLSFVAQYEQRSLSNVTSRRDNFSFGIRLRRRF
jgi:translocation and assembly module TamB